MKNFMRIFKALTPVLSAGIFSLLLVSEFTGFVRFPLWVLPLAFVIWAMAQGLSVTYLLLRRG